MFAEIGLRHRNCPVEQYNGLQRGHHANTGRGEITPAALQNDVLTRVRAERYASASGRERHSSGKKREVVFG